MKECDEAQVALQDLDWHDVAGDNNDVADDVNADSLILHWLDK